MRYLRITTGVVLLLLFVGCSGSPDLRSSVSSEAVDSTAEPSTQEPSHDPSSQQESDPVASESSAPVQEKNEGYYNEELENASRELGVTVKRVYPFQDGLACVEVELPEEILQTIPFMSPRYFGFIDESGQYVIPPYCIESGYYYNDEQLRSKYDRLDKWSDRGTLLTQVVSLEGPLDEDGYRACNYHVLDREGNYIRENVCDYMGDFRELVAPASKDGKEGFVNEYGEIVIDFQFDSADCFSDGRASVRIGDKYGYIDHNGVIVVPPQYDYATRYHNGYALVYPQYFRTFSLDYANEMGDIGYRIGEKGSDSHAFFTYAVLDSSGAVVLKEDQILKSSYEPFWNSSNGLTLPVWDTAGLEPQIYTFEKHIVLDFNLSAKNAKMAEDGKWEIVSDFPAVSAVDVSDEPQLLHNFGDGSK